MLADDLRYIMDNVNLTDDPVRFNGASKTRI